ncbi:MAG TPA: protein kinase [Gemmatimonadales bacterium]|nr:protein kinase [Gemmatimonadales bacterium]
MTDASEKPLAARLSDALADAYTIEGEIGRGGMGVVYRARDERLQRRVAIKVLPPELAFQQDIRERFTREAQTAAKLSHPHVVPIFSVGEGSGLVYFVMGYVDGESVAGRLKRRGRLPVEEARRIMKEAADALGAAHAQGVVHRDVKPDNILLEGTRGRVMVTDFGIAKALSGSSGATLTGVGVAIGTPSYMSPEQAAGEKEIDGRSDLYSLGIVAYQMLTGELPFTAPTVAGILMKQITEPAQLVTELRPDVPEDLAMAVARCLEKDPENRWPTADALRRGLESRAVGGYRPTGTGFRAATRPGGGTAGRRDGGTFGGRAAPARPGTAPAAPLRDRTGRPLGAARGAPPISPMPAGRRDALARRYERGRVAASGDELPAPDTGEPKIVQKTRAQFAKWAAVTLGCFGINVATGIHDPWFLFPAVGFGFGLIKSYSVLWQSGYSWRDVLNRPPAPDAIETTLAVKGGKLPRQLPPPSADDYGAQLPIVQQMHGDRQFILKFVEKLPPAERKMLPEIGDTVDALYNRAAELARALHDLDSQMNTAELARIEERLAALDGASHAMDGAADEEGEITQQRRTLLQRQRQTILDLQARRGEVASHLERCVLAMQNLRLDLIKLRTADVASVLGDLTQATQQARAVSRNVDVAISAAGEIRDALR